MSPEILIPPEGYAGPGASLLKQSTSQELELAQKQKGKLSRQVAQQLAFIRDLQRDAEEARTKLLLQEEQLRVERAACLALKTEVEALKWELGKPPYDDRTRVEVIREAPSAVQRRQGNEAGSDAVEQAQPAAEADWQLGRADDVEVQRGSTGGIGIQFFKPAGGLPWITALDPDGPAAISGAIQQGVSR
jgi:hypothetical protein